MLSRHILKAVPNFLTLKITRNWRKGKIFRSQIQAEKKNICRAEKKSILIVSLVWAELGDLQAGTNLLRAISARSEMLCWIYTTESFWLKLSERNLIFQTFLWDAHVSCTWVPPLQWQWAGIICQPWMTISLVPQPKNNFPLQYFTPTLSWGVGNAQVDVLFLKQMSPGSA